MPPRTRTKTTEPMSEPKATTEQPAADQITPEQIAEAEARIAELEAELAARAEQPRNVIEAILAVMREVRAVGKDGTNEQQGFKFRGIDGTVNALGPAMRKHGLVVVPGKTIATRTQVETGRNRTLQNSVSVEVEYHFYGPGGVSDTITAHVPGESFDSGDKATAKAMSVAFRTCLLQTFALPTQDRDPDADSHELSPSLTGEEVVERATETARNTSAQGAARMNALIALANGYGRERLEGVLCETKEGPMTGAEYFDKLIAYYAPKPEQSAPAPAEGAEQGAPQQAEQAAPAPEQSAPVQSEGERAAAEQTRADVAASSAPTNRFMDALVSEIAGHADVIGTTGRVYVEPLLAAKQGAQSVTELPLPIVRQWVIDQRPAIVGMLRSQGRASVAAVLEGIGNAVQPWEVTLGAADQNAGAEAPAHV